MIIYHGSYEPAPSNTWIEISHAQVPTELKGMWCWRLRGSGVWFNTGNTITFPENNGTHADAFAFLREGCSVEISTAWPRIESDVFGSCAREKGYNSVQFEPDNLTPLGTFGQAGLTELVITDLDGQYRCGTADGSKTSLRSGWMASQHCDCEEHPPSPFCGLVNQRDTDPPMCKAKSFLPWLPCSMAICPQTTCLHRSTHSRASVEIIA